MAYLTLLSFGELCIVYTALGINPGAPCWSKWTGQRAKSSASNDSKCIGTWALRKLPGPLLEKCAFWACHIWASSAATSGQIWTPLASLQSRECAQRCDRCSCIHRTLQINLYFCLWCLMGRTCTANENAVNERSQSLCISVWLFVLPLENAFPAVHLLVAVKLT